MRPNVLVLLGVALVLSPPTYAQTKVGTAADEAAILKNRDAQNAAYNRHDGKAYAALMTVDADRVDAAGTLTGRAQIEKYYSASFAADMTRVVKDEQRKVRFVTSDTALLDVDNVVTTRNGIARNHGTWIYVKQNGQWVSVAQRVIQKP
jgi:uncharacterized protein (TIGR02246 family)